MTNELKRNYCFTSYLEDIKPSKYSYIVYGHEVCPTTGKKHLQGYVEFKSGVSRAQAQKRIGDGVCHVESRRGTAAEAAAYCKKDGNFVELGEMSKAGERTDLQIIKKAILSGESTISTMLKNDIINNYQELRFAECLMKYKSLSERKPVHVTWIHGPTQTGKTARVFATEGLDIFKMEANCEWFDGYTGQEVALFDDYRGQFPLCVLLQILDVYPLRLRCKGGFIEWTPVRIYVTSDRSPIDCYPHCGERLNQLTRRIHCLTNTGMC